ncbi:MAG: DEAD/DEAH box helicase family protein [Clostridia bacterium]|nr:DEAD/DEAH box helicase family protein [Clostridia bacterium]
MKKISLQSLKEMLFSFKKNLSDMGNSLTTEDLEVAEESLKRFSTIVERYERQERIAKKRAETTAEQQAEIDRHVEEVTRMELPMDWSDPFFGDARAAERVESATEGLILSLNTLGCVDIAYIASVTGKECKEVIEALRGAIFQNPDRWDEDFTQGWETADEYLSGNLAAKWRRARSATQQYHGYFDSNVKALEELLPPSVATDDIYVSLGSPWVPTNVIDEFIEYMAGAAYPVDKLPDWGTTHDEDLGVWEIPYKNRYAHSRQQRRSSSVYGTSRMNMLEILESTLNMRPITVYDTVSTRSTSSGKRRELNEGETLLALEKQKKMIAEFQQWVFRDAGRRELLQDVYDSRYGAIRQRQFDGSILAFPTMAPEISLYPYQRNAVARMIFTPNTLLAHSVGAGKTYEMVAAGMEMRRMGVSKKNLYVVPGNLVSQWRDIFLKMYPSAKLLCVNAAQFTPQKRNNVLEQIRDGDFDGIIMAYSCFDMIPLSFSYYEDVYREAQGVLDKAKQKLRQRGRLDRKRKQLLESLLKTKNTLDKMVVTVPFDELGINTLFVDEAHNYKNVPVETKVGHVPGISSTGSEKCKGMMEKVHCVQKQNNGRGAILATGTPVTNSITDLYIMQKYLQDGELALMGLQSFDSWIGMFAEKQQSFEIDVDTASYRMVTRFSRFHNLPELTAILSSVSDFYENCEDGSIPRFKGYTDVLVGKTPALADYLKEISHRADSVRAGKVKRTEDNMLQITSDGRKAALDIRLVEPKAGFHYSCKAVGCAENVYEIYRKGMKERTTQLIFCDTSVPKAGFILYDETKRLLVGMGIPESEIAFVYDYDTERRRAALFGAVRRGDIRVLMGSTFKLGLGVNVQDKLIAVHHLDSPWRPADMTQRNGRLLRQGNTNPEVKIFRYVTEGSFDAYSYQLLENKQRFISQLLSGSLTQRSGSDVDSVVLSYAEVKALAVGNPLLKRRVEVSNELTRAMLLQKEEAEERQRKGQELLEMPARLAEQQGYVDRCRADIDFYKANKQPYTKEEAAEICSLIDSALKESTGFLLEREITVYQGFSVVAPALMQPEKPHVWLMREGRYYLELGAAAGIVRRMDFFLDELERQEARYIEVLEKLKNRESALREEQECDSSSYAAEIERLREELARIDKKLGVKKDE